MRKSGVSAAFEAFGVAGYRNASMVQIAAQCGVSRAGLAHHFPTKETLLAAVLEERDRVNGELFFQGFDATADGLDYFARLVRVIEHNATTPGAVGLYATLSVEASDPGHPAHSYFIDRYTWLRRDLRQALAEVAGRGLVRPGVDLHGVESDLIALIDGLQIQWLLDPSSVDIAADCTTGSKRSSQFRSLDLRKSDPLQFRSTRKVCHDDSAGGCWPRAGTWAGDVGPGSRDERSPVELSTRLAAVSEAGWQGVGLAHPARLVPILERGTANSATSAAASTRG